MFWKINHSFSINNTDRPLPNYTSISSYKFKIPSILIPSLYGNCSRPFLFFAFSVFFLLNTISTTLHAVENKDVWWIVQWCSPFSFPALTLQPLFVITYSRRLSTNPFQCFQRNELYQCVHLKWEILIFSTKSLNFQQLLQHHFCSCSNYLFLYCLLSQDIKLLFAIFYLNLINSCIFLGFIALWFQVLFPFPPEDNSFLSCHLYGICNSGADLSLFT